MDMSYDMHGRGAIKLFSILDPYISSIVVNFMVGWQ